MPGFAAPTPAQREGYQREVKITGSDKVKAMIKAASPEISAFIEKSACLAEQSAQSALKVHAAPGMNLTFPSYRPMATMQHHDKAHCLSVKRVHGWNAVANNALQFEVLYVADDSGESVTRGHEIVRQPDGAWLFTN